MTFVSRPTVTRYAGPDHPHFITERDVRAALDFLVAIEPAEAASMAEYEASLAPRRDEVEIAMGTLRGFAEQTDPLTLEALQRAYALLVDEPPYRAPRVAAVVRGALRQAWNGVGPWRN